MNNWSLSVLLEWQLLTIKKKESSPRIHIHTQTLVPLFMYNTPILQHSTKAHKTSANEAFLMVETELDKYVYFVLWFFGSHVSVLFIVWNFVGKVISKQLMYRFQKKLQTSHSLLWHSCDWMYEYVCECVYFYGRVSALFLLKCVCVRIISEAIWFQFCCCFFFICGAAERGGV